MSCDDLVIGGGHNGLTAAAVLAARGRKVTVVEARPGLGGLAAPVEFHPGHRSPGILHETALLRPAVVQALELRRHGLRLQPAPEPLLVPSTSGPGLLLPGDGSVPDGLSERDAAGYTRLRSFVDRVRGYVTALLDAAPPSLAPRGIREHAGLLGRLLALRRLGRDTLNECLRIGPMSAVDLLREHVGSPALQAALAAPALVGGRDGPRAAGTAAQLLLRECRVGPEVLGGPAALVRALESACRERGVEILTGAPVRRLLEVDGGVAGAELESGEAIEARRVVSSVDPRRTFLELLPRQLLPLELADRMRSWRCRGTTAKVHLALDGPLEFAGRPGEPFAAISIGEDLFEIERAFDAVKYRQLPEAPVLDVRVPTLGEPGLAPAGHHVVSILVHAVPHDLEGGWNAAAADQLLRRVLGRLSAVAPACADRIVGHQVVTPLDLQREYGLTGGHVLHGEPGLDQLLSLRPAASCSRYATPVRGLFLCGSGSHPGGGITGAPGLLAAGLVG